MEPASLPKRSQEVFGRTRPLKEYPRSPPPGLPPGKNPGVQIKEASFDSSEIFRRGKKKRPEKASRKQSNEFIDKLEAAGLTKDLAQVVIGSKGNVSAKRVVAFIEKMLSGKRMEKTHESTTENITNGTLVEVLERILDLCQSGQIEFNQNSSECYVKINDFFVSIRYTISWLLTPVALFSINESKWTIYRGWGIKPKKEYGLIEQILKARNQQIKQRKRAEAKRLRDKLTFE